MNKITGFTLIEVLVSMLILSVGLLGLAGLQVASLRNNQSAYNRSQATQLAYDLADRMRTNVLGVATYTTIPPSRATAKASCLTTTGCSQDSMAENDLYEWNSAVSAILPNGIGTITAAAGELTVTINWDDDRDGVGSNNLQFQTSFQL